MSSLGRHQFHKQHYDDAAEAAENTPVFVGLRSQGSLAFFRSLPHACLGFLFAVFCDVFVMVAYGSVLLVTGLGASSFYFASLILSASLTLVYFSISAIRSENTVELLAAVGIASCVNATVFYFRANENAFAAVQARAASCVHATTTGRDIATAPLLPHNSVYRSPHTTRSRISAFSPLSARSAAVPTSSRQPRPSYRPRS